MSFIKETFDELKLAIELLLAKRKYTAHDGLDHSIVPAGRAGMRSGKISEFTVIAPLKKGGAERLKTLLHLIKGNLGGAILVGTVHDLRFIFLENDTKMLFCTSFDGDWDNYIDDFATKIPELMDLIFQSVEGWPGIADPNVKDFILQYQLTAAGWFVAYPHLTVNDILRQDKIVKGVYETLDAAAN